MKLRDREGTTTRADIALSGSRPVMLVTFDVPVRTDAATFAVDSAVESGQPLLLVNMTHVVGYLFLRAYALYRKRQLAGP